MMYYTALDTNYLKRTKEHKSKNISTETQKSSQIVNVHRELELHPVHQRHQEALWARLSENLLDCSHELACWMLGKGTGLCKTSDGCKKPYLQSPMGLSDIQAAR
ncbi:hypothetical protein GWI33_016351 [Rhynchophorus ferrugineus]|uniref:Uncharacterized protein n=1 Tax=Rhynchophorus ferrugineus TaxID=354439 RepID=A0A834IBB8_RHYFE|nr:hypothetical protein GWI33_016351 [Rhynchophorus ferrugineus]